MWDSAKKPLKIRSVVKTDGTKYFIVGGDHDSPQINNKNENKKEKVFRRNSIQEENLERKKSCQPNPTSDFSREVDFSNKVQLGRKDCLEISGNKMPNAARRKPKSSGFASKEGLWLSTFLEDDHLQNHLAQDDDLSQSTPDELGKIPLVLNGAPCGKSFLVGNSRKSQENSLCSRIFSWIDLEIRKNGRKNKILPVGYSGTNESRFGNNFSEIPTRKSDEISSTSSYTSSSSTSKKSNLKKSTNANTNATASSSSSEGEKIVTKKSVRIVEDETIKKKKHWRKKLKSEKKILRSKILDENCEKLDCQDDRVIKHRRGNANYWGEVKLDDCTVYLMGETGSRPICEIEVPEKIKIPGEMLKKMQAVAPGAPLEKLSILNNFAYSVVWSNDPDFRNSEENPWAITLPHFPLENLLHAARLLELHPDMSLYRLMVRLYPYEMVLEKDEVSEITAVDEILTSSGFVVDRHPKVKAKLSPVSDGYSRYVPVPTHEGIVSEMLESHSIGRDICIIGDRGSGKSAVVSRFSEITGYKVEPIVMYKDMTARDLLQQRTTNEKGDTVWKIAPLVKAALEGKLALLDGLDQVHSSTSSVIFRLVHDRELQLHDGKRLIRQDRFQALKKKHGYSDKELNEKYNIFEIHPNFYVIASAAPPPKSGSGKNQKQWLTPEMLSLFFYHQLPTMSHQEEVDVITSFCNSKELTPHMENIVKTARELRDSKDSSKKSLSSSLSTRQLIRMARRNERFIDDEHGPFEEISRACLARFLPPLNREELESVMKKNGIKAIQSKSTSDKTVELSNNILKIGATSTEIWPDTEFKSKVPHVLFYNIQQHIKALEELLRDYLMGEHLLLVGNQGVGKNKLVDQLLFLLNRPREYIQLHRDTTVQALTLQQKVIDGVVSIEDSPLVRAAREGHVIIIDEADKAPTHVTCILKTLAESGEMILSDNRRIVPQSVINKHYKGLTAKENEMIIPLHPDFRMFVLANRPGFPFLGNDFYSVLGDLFSVHAIDNPSFASEVELLKQYGPEIPIDYLERIAKAFGDLRTLSDEGTIPYPYSTREAVNIVKHLQKYPNDSISAAIDNVFDFDVYNSELRQTVKQTLKKYKLEPSDGVLLRNRTGDEGVLTLTTIPVSELTDLQRQGHMNPMQHSDKKFGESDFGVPKHGKVDSTGAPHVGGNTWAGGSGGRDTAGLGGAGGGYRLDSGNPVFQVSDEVKQIVPPEVRKMARAMAQKAFEEKLKEIKMSKYDGNVYEQYLGPIRPQVEALRVILSSLQAKAKERKWAKHQTSGEMDDTKLIESVVGEKNIYKRRREEEPEPGDPQEKPKKLVLIVDVSGSMYRFNGYDRRLDRMLECALLVMESFQGFEDIFEYEIIGHSGDGDKVPLVEKKYVPKDNKERMDILRVMHLHSQFCASGDNTLEATDEAIKALSEQVDDYDESFVLMLSDANLERYGIPPRELGKILNSNDDIKAFAIFIGSLGDQAERLTEKLPPGKSFVCLDTAKLPQILQRIFTQTILH